MKAVKTADKDFICLRLRPTELFGESVPRGAQVNRTILLVDDNEDTCLIFAAIVKRLGYACVRARNGSEAFNQARTTLPDIIFMDYMMPVMDGIEASRLIKADTQLEPIPIIFYTAILGLSERAREAGACGVLQKPASISAIQDALDQYLPPRAKNITL